ncbi:Spermidine/putrescine import ATP-binding protein PotA [compost metagenome]
MSDRVAVFNRGRIEQVDTPRNLYMKPATTFVAEFVGTSNVIRGELAEQLSGSRAPFSIRPEHIRLADSPGSGQDVQISGLLHDIQYQGSATRYEVQLDSGQLLAVSHANDRWQDQPQPWQTGQTVQLHWPREAMTALQETVLAEGR